MTVVEQVAAAMVSTLVMVQWQRVDRQGCLGKAVMSTRPLVHGLWSVATVLAISFMVDLV